MFSETPTKPEPHCRSLHPKHASPVANVGQTSHDASLGGAWGEVHLVPDIG